MKIRLLLYGKTSEPWLKEGCESYFRRIGHYYPFSMEVIPEIRHSAKLDMVSAKKKEAEKILERISGKDYLVLLDEKGQATTSRGFSEMISKLEWQGVQELCFLIAGPFGADPSLKQQANATLSLSQMTFPHQLVRVIFLEQLYRAMTILRNEKYHND